MKKWTLMSVAMLAVLCSGALAETIYTNDFGTASQLSEFEVSSGSGSGLGGLLAGPIGTTPYPDSGYNYLPGADLDGDGLFNSASVYVSGQSGWTDVRYSITADEGQYFDNLVISGIAGGYNEKTNYAQISISNDGGSTWLFDSTRNDRTGAWVGLLEVDTTDEAGWDNVTSVILQIKIATYNTGGVPANETFLGILQNITVSGDVIPEPATMLLLAAGGLPMLLKRRK